MEPIYLEGASIKKYSTTNIHTCAVCSDDITDTKLIKCENLESRSNYKTYYHLDCWLEVADKHVSCWHLLKLLI